MRLLRLEAFAPPAAPAAPAPPAAFYLDSLKHRGSKQVNNSGEFSWQNRHSAAKSPPNPPEIKFHLEAG
jgi:hypothetical protein